MNGAFEPFPSLPHYLSTLQPDKADRHHLLSSPATDVAPSLIRINALSPAWVRTPMFAAECAKAPGTDSLAAKVCPPGRVAEVDEVGNSAVYLLSPAGGYVSGASLMVDYGLSVGPKVL